MPSTRSLTTAGKPDVRRTGDVETFDGRQPAIDRGRARVARRPSDGASSDRFMAFKLVWSLWEGANKVSSIELDESPIDVTITSSRVIVETNRFERGGGWFGSGIIGVPFAIIANIASHSRIVARRQSHVFAAHVEHAWLTRVTANPVTKGTYENVVLTYQDDALPAFRITTTLCVPPRVDSCAIARCLADRAAEVSRATVVVEPSQSGSTRYVIQRAKVEDPE